MALKSSNIANTLLQTLTKLTSQGENLVITKDTAKPISTLITVCNLLVDSAETVGENQGDPDTRNRIFDYAVKIRNEMKTLEDIKKKIEVNPQEIGVKQKLLDCAKIIANLTSDLVSVNDDALLRKVMESSKVCATNAKILISSTEKSYEAFFEACKHFGGSCLDLAKLLQEVARNVKEKNHQQKIINSYNNIKEIGPQLIRAAKRAYESPQNVEIQQELHLLARQLAGKISYAISVAQPDGGNVTNEISTSQPTVPIPPIEQLQAAQEKQQQQQQVPNSIDKRNIGGRKRTITHPTQGSEVLSRVKTATTTKQINETIEQSFANKKEKENSSRTSVKPNNPVSDHPANDLVETYLSGLEEEEETNANQNSTEDWKTRFQQLEKSFRKLEDENKLLHQENENLHKALQNMHERLKLRETK